MPFGFDPQVVDLVSPLFAAAIRVEVEGGEHVPTTGPAVLVANRGFGIVEPAVLGIAVRRVACAAAADRGCAGRARDGRLGASLRCDQCQRARHAARVSVRAISSRFRSRPRGCGAAPVSRPARSCKR